VAVVAVVSVVEEDFPVVASAVEAAGDK